MQTDSQFEWPWDTPWRRRYAEFQERIDAMNWISWLLGSVGFRKKRPSRPRFVYGELVVVRFDAKNHRTNHSEGESSNAEPRQPNGEATTRERLRSRSRRSIVLPAPSGESGSRMDSDRRYFELQGTPEDLKLLKERIDSAIEQILMETLQAIVVRERLELLITPRGKVVAKGERSMSTLEGLILDDETRLKFSEAGILIRDMSQEEVTMYTDASRRQIPNALTPYASV